MAAERIARLEQFIKEDPADPFNYYALALEYLHIDKLKAQAIFIEILATHKGYLPVYYQLGKLYEDLGDLDKAIESYRQGVTIALQQNDLKTLRELQAALQLLLDDQE